MGDVVRIKGHTSDFTQQVASIQIEHKAIDGGKPGQGVAIKVVDHAHTHNEVFKVVP